jgi:hypothetical protein
MRLVLRFSLVLMLATAPLPGRSEPLPQSGRYERFSPLTMTPSGPLDEGATGLPSFLDVTTVGQQLEIVFRPEGRIHWKLTYGTLGLVQKTTFVDGAVWTQSDFTYDGAGHLSHKQVSGNGAAGGLAFDYKTDAQGRVVERTGFLPSRQNAKPATDLLKIVDAKGGRRVQEWLNGMSVRVDQFDAAGRLLKSEFGQPTTAPAHLTLLYDRDSQGRLIRVRRQRGNAPPKKATPGLVNQEVTSLDLQQLSALVERSEVLLLLGAPVTHTVTSQGSERTVSDNYFKDCKLNQPSALYYDPADLVKEAYSTCVCGFCVEGDAEPVGNLLGRDEHWTQGPWVRLNDTVNVTADHLVLTPTGGKKAGTLQPGELLINAQGKAEPLRQIEFLPDAAARLGVNLRTDANYFIAGGLRFLSEPVRTCVP